VTVTTPSLVRPFVDAAPAAVRPQLEAIADLDRRLWAIVAQGRAGKRGRFRTFADGTVRRDGRFRIHYRFRDPASRGRTFQFRIKIERDSGYAYWGGYSRIAKVRVR